MRRLFFVIAILLPCWLRSQSVTDNSLNGQWGFALDPLAIGETQNWFLDNFPFANFDKVNVPHCFSVDPRYMYYTGTAWYFKKFAGTPGSNERLFLRFDAVFYKAGIWLNGQLLGRHEGGYTPFEFDITGQLKETNTLAVRVNNEWDTTTLPGAKTAVDFSGANNNQVYPWINYGGITRPVHLVSKPQVFIGGTKILAVPDLKKGDATVTIKLFLQNKSAKNASIPANAAIYANGIKTGTRFKQIIVNTLPGGETIAELNATMPPNEVRLWSPDAPNLYTAEVIAGTDTVRIKFGIRKIEVAGTKLLLNGEPVKMGGCNRPLDYPGYGSMDPAAVLEKDLTLVKSGGMELSRINHHPVSEALLNWADEHGLMIIEEAGNWQMTPKQMDDTLMRQKFRQQMKEMVARDWNHPCVVAYSVGNEFQSQTSSGQAWVRDMIAYVKSIDNSRLMTFASMMVWRDVIKKPEDEASQYVDFVSANIYGNHLKNLQHIHELYPAKPVYLSEFGIRTDAVKNETERIDHLKKAMQDFRQCDFLVGASVWTFNDYFSRFPGTGSNGYRPWGLVSPEREERGMYTAWQEEFAPAVIEIQSRKQGKAIISITARKDFPSYTMRGYLLQYNGEAVKLNTLQPGEQQQLEIPMAGTELEVQLIKPGGFVIMKKILK